MKRVLVILLVSGFYTLSAGESWCADFQKGTDAYQNRDYATALREWKPLAEQGNAPAQYNLGQMYYSGRGVPRDLKTAAKWDTLAAEQGHADAQYNLGGSYRHGLGVLQDHQAATKWYKLAAEQGHAEAQWYLAVAYRNGEGVIQDYIYAHMWMNIAASSGLKMASENRDSIAKRMSSSQIEKAQDFARECVRKKYKGC